MRTGIGRRAAFVALAALAVVVPGTATGPAGAVGGTAALSGGGVRYLDPLFAGSLAAVDEVSYVPGEPLRRAQTLTVRALAGTFTLSLDGQVTPALPATASAADVAAAIGALPSADLNGDTTPDVVVTGGPGGLTGGTHLRVSFTAPAPLGGYPALSADGSQLLNLPGFPAEAAVQCDHCLDVHAPVEATLPPGGRAAVIVLHGGGFTGGSKDGTTGDPNGARTAAWSGALAERGYVALAVNYTLADAAALPVAPCDWDGTAGPACGAAFYSAVETAQHDVQAAVRWLRWTARAVDEGGLGNPYGVDPSRIVVVGESAGAFIALSALARPDDPGTVGVTSESSALAGGVALAGALRVADLRAGMPPTLLLTSTNDPLLEPLGMDMYDQSRKLVARAGEPGVGALVESVGYCTRPAGAGGAPQPVHLADLASPDWADQVARASRFLHEHAVGPSPTAQPAPARWLTGTRTPPLTARPGQVLAGDHLPATGDFDGDSRADVLWYGPGGGCDTIWFGRADGTFTDPDETAANVFTPAVDVGAAYVPTVADFDGDGRTDVLWYDPTTGAGTRIWYGEATRTFADVVLGTVWPGLTMTAGDFDGDGRADIVLSRAADQAAIAVFATPVRGQFTGATPATDLGTMVNPVVGDLDGDGIDDIYWSGGGVARITYGAPRVDKAAWVVAAAPPPPSPTAEGKAADVDGDGLDDLLWTTAGGFRVAYGSPIRGTLTSGGGWFVAVRGAPTTGDLDGDGRADLVWLTTAGGVSVWYGSPNRGWGFVAKASGLSVPSSAVPLVAPFAGSSSAAGHPVADLVWSTAPA